jgi:hypothetical protein
MDVKELPSQDRSLDLTRLLNHRFKNRWTPDEDNILFSLVPKFGLKKWALIAKSIPGRNGKQCRDRWLNHLNPQVNKSAWSVDEEWRLFLLHQLLPGQWKRIAQHLSGRTENSVKNKWHCIRKTNIQSFEKTLEILFADNHDFKSRVGFIKSLLAFCDFPRDLAHDQLRDVSNFYQLLTPIKKQNNDDCHNNRPTCSETKQMLFESTMSGRKSITGGKSAHKQCHHSPHNSVWDMQNESNIGKIYLTPIKNVVPGYRGESDSKSIFSINFNSFK